LNNSGITPSMVSVPHAPANISAWANENRMSGQNATSHTTNSEKFSASAPAMVPVLGIAGAVVGAEATVVAVCSGPPGDYDLPRLQGAFSELYGQRTTCLVVSAAEDYPTLVASWLEQVDDDNVNLRSVESLRDGDLLRITLDRPLASPEQAHPGRPSLNGSEVEALRRLLPHRHIEFTTGR
jgi:hypothetical protein